MLWNFSIKILRTNKPLSSFPKQTIFPCHSGHVHVKRLSSVNCPAIGRAGGKLRSPSQECENCAVPGRLQRRSMLLLERTLMGVLCGTWGTREVRKHSPCTIYLPCPKSCEKQEKLGGLVPRNQIMQEVTEAQTGDSKAPAVLSEGHLCLRARTTATQVPFLPTYSLGPLQNVSNWTETVNHSSQRQCQGRIPKLFPILAGWPSVMPASFRQQLGHA